MSALREEWYSLLQHDFHNNGTHLTVRSSPFIAYIPSDDSRKEINEVAFDKYIFSRQYYIEVQLVYINIQRVFFSELNRLSY